MEKTNVFMVIKNYYTTKDENEVLLVKSVLRESFGLFHEQLKNDIRIWKNAQCAQ